MEIVLNGHGRSVPDALTVATLLNHLALRGRLAVEVNGEIVPRSRFDSTLVHASDRIEIVKAIGGG